jgi:hypothetical protein
MRPGFRRIAIVLAMLGLAYVLTSCGVGRSEACDRYDTLNSHAARVDNIDPQIVALAKAECNSRSSVTDQVPLRTFKNGTYTARGAQPCSAVPAGSEAFVGTGSNGEILLVQCIADRVEYVRFFEKHPINECTTGTSPEGPFTSCQTHHGIWYNIGQVFLVIGLVIGLIIVYLIIRSLNRPLPPGYSQG